jgi:hypothetical protein
VLMLSLTTDNKRGFVQYSGTKRDKRWWITEAGTRVVGTEDSLACFA